MNIHEIFSQIIKILENILNFIYNKIISLINHIIKKGPVLLKLLLSRLLIFLKAIKNYFKLKIIAEISFKVIYIILIIIICINLFNFSYKAFLYPIRMSQYYDECSYIAMGKFFRTITPVTIIKDYALKKKELPTLYNEFYCRMLYWPIILSFPLKFTEDRVLLHIFRAILMTIGTIIFFLLGHKLSGITGGIATSIFWICTPLLNYWSHFFMTESPSLIFIGLAYLLLLYSDRSRISSIFAGIFMGIAILTRFTTAVLIFPAPFLILAAWLNPFKRKNFQLLGEWAKAFSGIIISVIPYFMFTFWLFKNPFTAFMSAMYAVDRFDVNDPLYYVRSLWIEAGPMVRTGIVISVFSPFIISLAWVFRELIKQQKIKDKNNSKKDSQQQQQQDLIYQNMPVTFKSRIKKIFKKIKNAANPIRVYLAGLLYYSIIILSLIISTTVYLYGVSDIAHKLPRYLMGALIPVIIAAGVGFGAFEPLLIYLFRFLGDIFLNLHKRIKKQLVWLKPIVITVWAILFCAGITALFLLAGNIWIKSANRPFFTNYYVPDFIKKELLSNDERVSYLRLQPEYLSWKYSIAERLRLVKENPYLAIDNRIFYGKHSWAILNFINKTAKPDEVFYVDRLNSIPYTPAYADVPCMHIDYTYGYSIASLRNKGLMPYKGFVAVSTDLSDDTIEDDEEEGKTWYRSLNRNSIANSGLFRYVRTIGYVTIYYYHAGKPFPFDFYPKDLSELREKNLFSKKSEIIDNTDDKIDDLKKETLKKTKELLQSWDFMYNYEFEEEIYPHYKYKIEDK